MTFRGFPHDAFAFFHELEADNTKAFWQANKPRYEAAVKAPMLALLDGLAEYGPFHTFRPYNDVRFSKNKPPYKTHIGSYGESEGGAGYYVQLAATGLMVAAGYYGMAADQLERFREAVAGPAGEAIDGICTTLQRSGYELGALSSLKTAPRGYPKDHPRIELLRRKGLTAARTFAPAAWMHTAQAADRVRSAWLDMAAMNAWLDSNVGPSMLAPEEGEMFRR
jgi:uncharacterized protein (TIGR02453 family)